MSVMTEIPSVGAAVGKLQELGDRMKNDDFGFKDCDVINLEKTIDAINELENERKLMHEKLETESIKCSILRHELKNLPQKIRDEIMAAVNAARQLNAEALKNLRDQLESMNSNILDMETQSEDLEKENIALRPECDLLRQQHEAIISQLNQKMADKAVMQITLNETRDKVRQANQNIVDLEEGMVQLKEDLIQERKEAKIEKKQLRKAVIETQTKTRLQKEQNMEKKKELDAHQERLVDSEGQLDALKKSLKHYEASKSMLEVDERQLSTQLDQQLKENEDLYRKGTEIKNCLLKEQKEFDDKQNELMKRIKTLEDNMATEREKRVKLHQQKTKLHIDLKDKERIKEEDALYANELDEQLRAVKRSLAEKAEEVGQLDAENMRVTEESKAVLEAHKTIKSQLSKQTEELTEQLAKEKKERAELQDRKDDVAKALDDLKSSHQQFINDMTDAVQEGKKRHAELSNKGLQLQKEVREAELEIETLQSSLSTAQQKYEEMFHTMQNKVDTMKAEISNMETDTEKKKMMISEKTPGYTNLVKFFSQRSEEYDSMKKSIVALKNKKSGLEDAINRAKKEKDSAKTAHETLQHDLKDRRTQIVSQIKSNGTEIKDIEQQIFLAGCQLRMILEENQRFEEACKKLEDDLASLEIQTQENEKLKTKSQTDLVNEKGDFMKMWKADNLMQEVFASRDQAIAEAFGHLLSKAERRENKIDEVTLKLRGELQLLSDFLSTIASQRSSAKSIHSTKRKLHQRPVSQQNGSRPEPSSTL